MVSEKFWAKVFFDGFTDCWHWSGTKLKGYGQIRDSEGKLWYTHRYAYEKLVGPIPDGLHLDHLCRITDCCNPKHLEPVTQKENNVRAKAVRTHCINGHEYKPDTIYWEKTKTGQGKGCLICRRERDRLRYSRKLKNANSV